VSGIAWTRNKFGAWCPGCGEHIADGSEDHDFGCSVCGYPERDDLDDGDDDDLEAWLGDRP
jgi:hypothetical protein